MNNLLEVQNLSVEFRVQSGSVQAVKDATFRVQTGSTLAIVGESGSGKSTIAQAIMGILPNSATINGGKILFSDKNESHEERTESKDILDIVQIYSNNRQMEKIRGGRISMIFQEPMTSLSPLHTIGDQIMEARLLHSSASKAEAKEIVIEMLRVVGFSNPTDDIHLYPFELSGGLRQRAMIAMALVCRPALLIADEPTTALDVTIQAQILKLMRDLKSELEMAVLMITHDLGVVANVADEVVVMYNGQIVEAGVVEDIYKKPSHQYLKSLLRAVPRFDMIPGERLIPIREIEPATGHLLTPDQANNNSNELSSNILCVKNISKKFNVRNKGMFGGGNSTIRAVDDVSFEIERGKTLGLVGESGCGKTTLSRIIMRALAADSGEIIFNDEGSEVNLEKLRGKDLSSYRTKYQYIFQDPFGALNPRMTVFDIVSEPLIIHDIGDNNYRREMVTELMELVGLDPRFLNRYPHSFSGGQRQRISIARSLALKPRLLLCDEPVSALDVSIQAQILNLLKDLQWKLGLTYLFISHNLAVVDYISDNIAVMCAGRIVERASKKEIFSNPVHPYTQNLLNAVPSPNPDKKLNLDSLSLENMSDPFSWPEPFKISGYETGKMVEVAANHFVRQNNIPSKVAK